MKILDALRYESIRQSLCIGKYATTLQASLFLFYAGIAQRQSNWLPSNRSRFQNSLPAQILIALVQSTSAFTLVWSEKLGAAPTRQIMHVRAMPRVPVRARNSGSIPDVLFDVCSHQN